MHFVDSLAEPLVSDMCFLGGVLAGADRDPTQNEFSKRLQ